RRGGRRGRGGGDPATGPTESPDRAAACRVRADGGDALLIDVGLDRALIAAAPGRLGERRLVLRFRLLDAEGVDGDALRRGLGVADELGGRLLRRRLETQRLAFARATIGQVGADGRRAALGDALAESLVAAARARLGEAGRVLRVDLLHAWAEKRRVALDGDLGVTGDEPLLLLRDELQLRGRALVG